MLQILLPWPPTVNTYWRRVGNRTVLSRAGRRFRAEVVGIVGGLSRLEGRLAVAIDLYPPDRRRRDIDNVVKAVLDALQHGGLYGDDSQIDQLTVTRRERRWEGGQAVVSLAEIVTSSPPSPAGVPA